MVGVIERVDRREVRLRLARPRLVSAARDLDYLVICHGSGSAVEPAGLEPATSRDANAALFQLSYGPRQANGSRAGRQIST